MDRLSTRLQPAKGPLLWTLTAGLALAVACGGKSNKPAASVPASAPAQSAGVQLPGTPGVASTPSNPVASAPRTPAASPTEAPNDSPLAKLIIPKINVSAKFVTLGLVAGSNVMDSPKNKDDVAYYDFSPKPTYGGNTLLSGHVDWYTGQTGVFWDLKKLEKGDDIQIQLQDGKTLHYRVSETHLYDADSAPTDEIVGDTPVESVTLITCEGTFDKAAAEYNKRRVVRGERVYS